MRFLPPPVLSAMAKMPQDTYFSVDEIRLRRNRPLSVVINQKNTFVSADGGLCRAEQALILTDADIDGCVSLLTKGSRYALDDAVANGYIPFDNMRAGVCGRTLVRGGSVATISEIDCIDIRLPRRVDSFADGLYRRFCAEGIRGTLVISPPGVGKTTYLRSLIVLMSARFRVAVCDCRGELLYGGVDRLPIDAMTSCPKGYAIETLTRTMNPEVIICDEISESETDAILQNAFCGVPIIASVHADGLPSALRRPFVRTLCKDGIFELYVALAKDKTAILGEIKCDMQAQDY